MPQQRKRVVLTAFVNVQGTAELMKPLMCSIADTGHRPEETLVAIHYLTELNSSKKRILDDAPEHIITGPW